MGGESASNYSASTVGNVEKTSPRTAQKVMKSLLKSERPFRYVSRVTACRCKLVVTVHY